MPMYDFANLLFSGSCNARCPYCIGKQVDSRLNVNNLDEFPPRNLGRFIALVKQYGIRQVVFTGSTTDPQLYRHEARLLEYLRKRLPPTTQYALHTNGRLALCKMAVFNMYDRVCLSFPSFHPATYQRMMGVSSVPDLAAILGQAQVPVKISCLVTDDNAAEISSFLRRCLEMGIRRVVLRKLYGERRLWKELLPMQALGLSLCREYRRNPVYSYHETEITLWDFATTASTSLNLFSTGRISSNYLLTRTTADNPSTHRVELKPIFQKDMRAP